MKIGPIEVVVKNGRVKAKAREHWRLVMPGERPRNGDECPDVFSVKIKWVPCAIREPLVGGLIVRRRVKGGT